jgi:hypothetical protein
VQREPSDTVFLVFSSLVVVHLVVLAGLCFLAVTSGIASGNTLVKMLESTLMKC